MAHNKTLAAQLYGIQRFFPANFVEYFVSTMIIIVPEVYVLSDTYIAKDASI